LRPILPAIPSTLLSVGTLLLLIWLRYYLTCTQTTSRPNSEIAGVVFPGREAKPPTGAKSFGNDCQNVSFTIRKVLGNS